MTLRKHLALAVVTLAVSAGSLQAQTNQPSRMLPLHVAQVVEALEGLTASVETNDAGGFIRHYHLMVLAYIDAANEMEASFRRAGEAEAETQISLEAIRALAENDCWETTSQSRLQHAFGSARAVRERLAERLGELHGQWSMETEVPAEVHCEVESLISRIGDLDGILEQSVVMTTPAMTADSLEKPMVDLLASLNNEQEILYSQAQAMRELLVQSNSSIERALHYWREHERLPLDTIAGLTELRHELSIIAGHAGSTRMEQGRWIDGMASGDTSPACQLDSLWQRVSEMTAVESGR